MRLHPVGFSHLGQVNADGIRYVWQIRDNAPYIESAAFKARAKIPTSEADRHISAYTTSVSGGCALTAAKVPCRFCRTGNTLRFSGPLSAREIAIQNVFMVLSDMEQAGQAAAGNLREFAYMGQGEPGYSYPQLREAIRITDKAMSALGQKVHRHLLATCGVTEMVDAFMSDLKNDYFNGTRVTFHYSLHAARDRASVMPIENIYSYREVIQRLPRLYELTGEKSCIGVLLFKNYRSGTSSKSHCTNREEILHIAAELDPVVCRISLCEFNPCDSVGTNDEISQAEAAELTSILEDKGFDVKLFASFGKQENTACGLLGGTIPDIKTDDNILSLYYRALSLVDSKTN